MGTCLSGCTLHLRLSDRSLSGESPHSSESVLRNFAESGCPVPRFAGKHSIKERDAGLER